jgi:hypothetical protein
MKPKPKVAYKRYVNFFQNGECHHHDTEAEAVEQARVVHNEQCGYPAEDLNLILVIAHPVTIRTAEALRGA